jgi:hypothetical protein
MKSSSPQALTLRELRVSDTSVTAVIETDPPGMRVDERLAEAAFALRPTLAQHVCRQQGFGYFEDTIKGTTLPHLVEHLAIDLLVEEEQRSGDAVCPVAGITAWLEREQGLMKVTISPVVPGGEGATTLSSDTADTVCAAIRRAIALVNGLLTR